MTKTKPRIRKPAPPRVIAEPEDAFLIGMAARAVGKTQAEFVRDTFRATVRRVLVSRGMDPDRMWSEYKAGTRN